MARFEMLKEGTSPQDFFTRDVPPQFEKMMKEKPIAGMEGTVFSLQFRLGGEKYCLKIIDAKKLEVIPGGILDPTVEFEMTEADWRLSVTKGSEMGGVQDQLFDPTIINRKSYELLKSFKGKLQMEILRPGKEPFKNTIRFNQGEHPSVAITVAQDDLFAISRGELDPQAAFMSGKIKAKGDVSLLIKILPLISTPKK